MERIFSKFSYFLIDFTKSIFEKCKKILHIYKKYKKKNDEKGSFNNINVYRKTYLITDLRKKINAVN